MEKQENNIEALFENATQYVETNIQLWKLRAIDKSSDVVSSLVSRIAVFLMFAFFLFILNIGLALWIGDALGKAYYGFFIIAGVYVIAGLLLYYFKGRWIKMPVANLIIRKFFQ